MKNRIHLKLFLKLANRRQIPLNGVLNVRNRFLLSLTLRPASGQSRT